jgi:hypothetical protein
MPPENTNPVAKTEPVEFEFDAPPPENPRMRKRNLKVRAAAETNPAVPARLATEREQPAAVYAQPAAVTHTAPTGPVYARPSATAERTPPAPASGVLYYSSNPGTKKEDSMKSIPHPQAAARPTTASQPTTLRAAAGASPSATARPATGDSYSQRSTAAASTPQASPARSAGAASASASSHSSVSSHAGSASRPASAATSSPSRAVSTTVASPSSSARPAGVSDYRSNIDRQSREQKSIGSILNLAVYALVGFFILATVLAAYGAHDVYKQLHAQSTTVSELDARYSAANQALNDKLTSTQAGIQQVQAQLSHAQELILRQQDLLTKMQASLDAQAQALREERATRAAETSIRAQETAVLRSRLRALEAKNDTYRP